MLFYSYRLYIYYIIYIYVLFYLTYNIIIPFYICIYLFKNYVHIFFCENKESHQRGSHQLGNKLKQIINHFETLDLIRFH